MKTLEREDFFLNELFLLKKDFTPKENQFVIRFFFKYLSDWKVSAEKNIEGFPENRFSCRPVFLLFPLLFSFVIFSCILTLSSCL